MIIDHCPAHLHLENLKSVVRSLKTKYGTIFTRRIIIALDNSKAILKFNILEAMCMLARAWDLVSTTRILKYFKITATSQIEAINDSDHPFSDLKYQLSWSYKNYKKRLFFTLR